MRAAAKRWAAELIDLGGRNTLLYYRDLKVGTLDLSEADGQTLAALVSGRSVRLSALVGAPGAAEAARRARTIAAKARENLEERGLATLYLAQGMATWDTDMTSSTPAAPLFLAPLSLRGVGAMEFDFDAVRSDDWELNPTFAHVLTSQFRVAVDTDALAELLDQPDGLTKALAALETAAAEKVPAFATARRIVVGNFSYAKQPMVSDLENFADAMCDNDVIAALAGDAATVASLRSRAIEAAPDDPDRTAPADEFLVTDADASQQLVINSAVLGANLVVQGPPGTGKSQTIANLVATLAARGRSVLFVAEKRAAIDAVVSRLDRAGLADLVLDLHGGAASRRKIVEELRRVYQASASVPAVHRTSEDARLVDRRDRLNAHARAMHAERAPWAISVFELQARLLGVPPHLRTHVRLAPGALVALSQPELAVVRDAMADWILTGGPAVERRLTPWSRAAAKVRTAADAQAALSSAQLLASDTLPSATTQLDHAVEVCGLRGPATVASWAETLALLREVAAVSEHADPAIWDLDLQRLAHQLAPAGAGAARRAVATLFDGGYRGARKAVGATLRAPLKAKALHDVVERAVTARALWTLCATDGGAPRLPGNLDGTQGAYQRLVDELAALGAYVGTSGLLDTDVAETTHSVATLLADQPTLLKMPRINELAEIIDRSGFGPVRQMIVDQGLGVTDAQHLIDHVWCSGVLEHVAITDPEVGAFDGAGLAAWVSDFRDADRAHIADGSAKVRRSVAEHLVNVRNRRKEADTLIGAEIMRKSRHKPLRELTQIAPEILLALKPCWAMSPLAVSQLLAPEQLFDVVIFDEASQIPPADAVPSLMRARQAIVAGDSKQLPPTTFFMSATAADLDEDAEGDADDSGLGNLAEGMESVLDAMANLVGSSSMSLRWHYRSRDERLIAFSNAQPSLYDWQMVTFPGTAGVRAVQHVYVPWTPSPGATSDSAGAEVLRVVELIREHAHTARDKSLGVIAMGIKHAERIGEALRRARAEDPVLDSYCNAHPEDPIFVKNLERVQGDERDAIILTIGYGKGPDGRMVHRFGPINAAGGERRLNVAITRARYWMTVVSSFLPADLDPDKLKSEGARMLGRYLAYAASGGTDLGAVQRFHPPLNPFESDVRDRLSAAGIPLVAQLGVSGYFIDFAAGHPSRPGDLVLAIEADGAKYHSGATARERDRLRQEHLERLGWRFHRIWSTDWFRNPDAEVAKTVAAWRSACALADGDMASPPPQPAQPPPSTLLAPPPPTPPAAPQRTSQPPHVVVGQSIDAYNDRQLLDIVRWVNADERLRTDDELVAAAMQVMGYQRRGAKIIARLSAAVRAARAR